MLSILGNIDESTYTVEIGKKKMLDGYTARINAQAAEGRLSVRSKVVGELVNAIFNTAIMAEYHDEDYLFERTVLIENLRRHFTR